MVLRAGIAYDAQKGRIFVTGKLWPQIFEISVTGSQPLQEGLTLQLARRMCIKQGSI